MSSIEFNIIGKSALLELKNETKLNALTMEMLASIETCLQEIEKNNNILAVILTGAGDRAFCSGADIGAWGNLSPAEFSRHWIRDGHRIFDRLARLCKPTIAAINGHAFGGGLELASCCDLRLIAPQAKLALPETRIGIVPGWSGTQRLTRLISETTVKEMVLFGHRINAERAVTLGFAAELTNDVKSRALKIALNCESLSPRATEIAKNMIHTAVGEDTHAAIDAIGSAAAGSSDDCKEGVTAFIEKRKPQFSGC